MVSVSAVAVVLRRVMVTPGITSVTVLLCRTKVSPLTSTDALAAA
jgi:hypothetical protein